MTKAGLSFAEQSTRALPRELLLRIFAMATELPADVPDDAPEDDARRSTHRTGAIPLVPKLASTCRAFRDVLRERPESVWRVVDLSYGWCRPSDAVIRRLDEIEALEQGATRFCLSGKRLLVEADDDYVARLAKSSAACDRRLHEAERQRRRPRWRAR